MAHNADIYDCFVSYAHDDDGSRWISGFIEELVAEHRKFSDRELAFYFDRSVIPPGADWQIHIAQHLSRARLFLAFISPRYLASEWCRREWRAWIDVEIAKHVLSDGARPVYIIEVPGLLDGPRCSEREVAAHVAKLCGLPAPHDDFVASAAPVVAQIRRRQLVSDFVQPFREEGIVSLRHDDLRRVLGRLARDLDRHAAHVRAAAESASTVPPYNKRFSGRLDDLLGLRERLKDDQAGVICGVHGLGGIGKTELAFTYAHGFAGAYPGGRFLLPCAGMSKLRDAVLVLADVFRDEIVDDDRKRPDACYAAICACLRARLDRVGHVLLVLDDVTDTALLRREETDSLTALGPKLHLLATTRLAPPAAEHARWTTLGELPERDALELLEKHCAFACEAERAAGRQIVRRLGGYTLAVELVAAYLAAHESKSYVMIANGLGLEDLESLARDEDVELRRHNHERRLQAVLAPTLSALHQAERRALEYAALLPPNHVPLPWLGVLIVEDLPYLAAHTRSELTWDDVWRKLLRLALLSRADGEGAEARVLRMHRLVQEVMLERMDAGQLRERRMRLEMHLELMAERAKALWHEPGQTSQLVSLAAAATHWFDSGNVRSADVIASRVVDMLRRFDRLIEARRLAEKMLDQHERANGERPEALAAAHQALALILEDQGQPSAARQHIQRSIAIVESDAVPTYVKRQALPHLHSTAGMIERALGHLQEARDHLERSLRLLTPSEDEEGLALPGLRPDDASLSFVLSNLGVVELDLGNQLSALKRFQRTIELQERTLGDRHPNMAISLANLARAQESLGQLNGARESLQRSLEISTRVFGELHSAPAMAMAQLASIEKDLGNVVAAREHAERALAIRRKVLPPNHPEVGDALSLLGRIAHGAGELRRAEEASRQALAIFESAVGEQRVRTAAEQNNLALILRSVGRPQEARDLLRRAIATLEQVPGAAELPIALYCSHLAGVEEDLGHDKEALALGARALAIATRILPSDSIDLAFYAHNQGIALQNASRWVEARELLARAATIRETLGRDHPSLILTLSSLARVEAELHRWDSAMSYIEHAIRIARRAAVEPRALPNALLQLAVIHDLRGDTNAKRHPLEEAIALLRANEGHETSDQLAELLLELGKLEKAQSRHREACAAYTEALAVWTRILPDVHPRLPTVHAQLAIVAGGLREFEEAHRELSIAERCLLRAGRPAPDVRVQILMARASVLDDEERYADAARIQSQAIDVLNSLHGEDHVYLAGPTCDLARYEQRARNLEASQRLWQRAIRIQCMHLGPAHPSVMTTSGNLAQVEYDLGNLEESRRLLDVVLAFDVQTLPANDVHRALTLYNRAIVEKRIGDSKLARQFMLLAYEIRLEQLGDEHERTEDARRWLDANPA